MIEDADYLRRYAADRLESAFAELVQRHEDLELETTGESDSGIVRLAFHPREAEPAGPATEATIGN